ncbi:MAG: zinc metallopeptidase [Firmicutes bacterium]|nr:zinc metallopeptidase [Bacillota bacterium]
MYYYDPTYILLVPAIIFTLIAQARVNSAFKRYSQVRNRRNLTGAEAARRMLDYNGLQDVRINAISGNLTDHYNPKDRTLNLSQSVYGVNSVAAVSVACHEAGHALQHAQGYTPLRLRNSIVPVVNFASRLAWPMIFIGILLLGAGSYEMGYFGMLLLDIGIIGFAGVVVFHAVTLPVEFDASRRAIDKMEEFGLVAVEDIPGSKKVLRAAALTYVAALATAVANLLRILAIRGRND